MAFTRLCELYPIGIDESKATEEEIKRFQRWKSDSLNFVLSSEEEAYQSFPKLMLSTGDKHEFVADREKVVEVCTDSFERLFPLKDGRLVVKKVVYLRTSGGNPEFGNEYPERMYFFR